MAGAVLTVEHAASIDHVCALHQRLRAPLIPFRDGKTSSGGERTESRDVKYANPDQNEGGAREGRDEIRAHTAEDPNPRVLRPGSLSLSPPGSQQPHHDAGITPGRRSPPSAPPAAAPSSFASSPPPQLSGGRGQWARAESPGAPRAGDRGPGTDGSDGGGGGGGAAPEAAGALSPRAHPPGAAGRGSLSRRMSSSSPPRSSPWGSSAEALETGGKGLSSAGRAPRHLCDLARRREGGGRQGGGLRVAAGRGGGVEGGEVGRGRSRKMAELPSGRLSHSPGLRDPPGSPGPRWEGAAALGRRPRGWCVAEWGAAGKDNTPAGSRGEEGGGVRTAPGSVTGPPPGRGGQRGA